MLKIATLALALLGTTGTGVWAGPYSDGETQLRQAYGAYRAALFLSNQGKEPETEAALGKFQAAWSTLATQWRSAPPPQYGDDPKLDATLTQVSDIVRKAEGQVADGALAPAHETLEQVRYALGDLHTRNGVIGFSDRMNAYHAEMEEVLGRNYAAMGSEAGAQLIEDAAILRYLAIQIVQNPAPEANDPAYQKLVDGLAISAANFYDAALSGKLPVALAARAQLKPSYARLFAKFG
ncbi:hypothetical protein AB4874_18365 [Thioclava sp. 15-R06ZXC-3]|uniref:Uncharacterized protein n=1 Tax=Thioclava arctica TaxID=3238301 RepID=A0ABV3TPM3_9RHOB